MIPIGGLLDRMSSFLKDLEKKASKKSLTEKKETLLQSLL